GPVIGGFLTTYVSWHWNFWVNLPLGAIGIALTMLVIPADGEDRETPFDWVGFVLSGLSLASLLYGFDSLANGTVAAWLSAALILLGLVSGTLGVLWLRRNPHPLLDLGPLRIKTFAAAE